MCFKERLERTILRRKRQSQVRRSPKCSDIHSLERGVPPPPLELLQLRQHSGYGPLSGPKSDPDSDTPLASLYRLYKLVVLRKLDHIEDEMDYFWSRRWEVASIPDPFERNLERGAVLACCSFLLAENFNNRISLDLVDDDQASRDRLEKPPRWALEVAPLPSKLYVGDRKGRSVVDNMTASKLFMIKNVQIDLTGLGLG